MPNLISDKENILFCAEADLYSELGTCRGDSGGPARQRGDLEHLRTYIGPRGGVTHLFDGFLFYS